MKIKVTQEHINKGERCRVGKCALALAFKDALALAFKDVIQLNESLLDVWVGCNAVFFTRPSKTTGMRENYPFSLPKEAAEFRKDFDTNSPVTPFEFEIDINP